MEHKESKPLTEEQQRNIRERRINSLIPKAAAMAKKDLSDYVKNGGKAIEVRCDLKGKELISSFGNRIAAGCAYRDYRNHCMWTEFFHNNMNRLAKEAGLRSI